MLSTRTPCFTVLTALLLLPAAVVLAQAADEQADPQMREQMQEAKTRGEKGDALTPLALGNTWVYENKDDGLYTTDKLAGVVEFDGEPWFLMRTTEEPIDAEAQAAEGFTAELWLSRQGGVEYGAFVEVDETTGALRLNGAAPYYRYPAAEGQAYEPDPETPSMKMRVVSVDTPVKTPAGEFSCVVYQQTFTDEPGYSFTTYVCPGVGVVRYETEEGGKVSAADLIRYTLVED